ncbi:hypothetical protein [Defluviimonas salinarum]|uniref:Transposase n=1 Tax=Defluviimonas salinarum TaxID=2992147 RepID=A0ABT3IXV1_9RHOB|nr:hypothetical protein [Defluviimonas salinarum]MCW3780270.1 hypothetical protein [Defluviimonas salinarum]
MGNNGYIGFAGAAEMLTGLNRSQWRRMAAKADQVARTLALCCLDYDRQGQLRAVKDPRAVQALERGFARMMRARGQAQVLRLTVDAASAFPRQPAAQEITGFPWLAVGLDAAASATYCLRYLDVEGRTIPDRRRAERCMLDELARHCARPGFPPWEDQR